MTDISPKITRGTTIFLVLEKTGRTMMTPTSPRTTPTQTLPLQPVENRSIIHRSSAPYKVFHGRLVHWVLVIKPQNFLEI
jgi:hypothetical protein